MKKLLVMALTLLLSGAAQAQTDVTRFLGIPVDGSKSEMIRQLKKKGFRSTKYDNEILEGEFDLFEVYVGMITMRNKVCCIMVFSVDFVDESAIKSRFNYLCTLFENNRNYISAGDQTIPENEKISQEMAVNKKEYKASFFQKPTAKDSLIIRKNAAQIIQTRYTKEQLADMTDEARSNILNSLLNKLTMEHAVKKSVWFIISAHDEGYHICMYYDNIYNHSNGEDL